MNEHFYNDPPIDRSKRPRLEDEVDLGYEHHGKEDRHPKRQAVPDPETKAPHFAGDEKKRQRTVSIRSDVDQPYSDASNILKNNDVSLSLRALVGTKDAGLIIGRGGKNVNEIREHSSARVTISDNIAGAHERILTVLGPVEAVAKAYSMVGEKILAEAPLADELDQQHEPTIAIRLLIPDFRMGNLIGRSGSIIKSIQEDTGARMSASEEPLPMSTERTMTIHGTPKSIHLAVARVAGILAEHPERNNPNHMPYVPHTMNPSLGGMNRSGYSGGRGGRNGSSVTGGMSDGAYGMSVPGGMPFFYQGVRPSDYGNMPSNSNQSQQIYIPNDMVGCIIGKGGSKINEIRQLSGSQIKIMDPNGDSNERLITVTGSHETNNMALYLLYSRLESEKARLGRI